MGGHPSVAEQYTILGGKVHVYRRPNSSCWQCSTYLAGRNRRRSTKEDSLSKAKEVAEDWYLQLRGKLRSGEIKNERTFREASDQYLREYDIITRGQRSKHYVRGLHERSANHLVPFFGHLGLSEITSGKIQEYRIHRHEESMAKRGKPPAYNTMHQEIVALRQTLKTAIRQGWLDRLPGSLTVELRSAPRARAAGLARFAAEGIDTPLIGVSPGAAFGSAKRWLPERFAASACTLAQRLGATVALHGSASERDLCESVCAMIAQHGIRAVNYAGRTTLEEFIERAAASRLFLTNDSGAMHIASALGVPTVAVFGPTNPDTTGPAGPLARIVRNPVECAPCLLRVCPIDHRCMTRVQHETVSHAALDLIQMAVEWTPESK